MSSDLVQDVTEALCASPEGYERHASIMARRMGLPANTITVFVVANSARECAISLISAAEMAGRTRREVLLAR